MPIRLNSYLESNPRRTMRIVIVLLISLILVVSIAILQAIHIERVFQPLYPSSESSPLSIFNDFVKWTNPQTNLVNDTGQYYRDMHIGFGYPEGTTTANLVNESEQNQLEIQSQSTIRHSLGWMTTGDNIIVFSLNVSVTDLSGDGCWSYGDYFIIEASPINEDTIYTVALAWVIDMATMAGEYSFAIHSGKLYSWVTDTFPTEGPWWE